MSLRKEPAPSGSVPVDKYCQVGESSLACCHAVPHSLDDDQSLPFWGACRLTPCSRGWAWGRSVSAMGCAGREDLRLVRDRAMPWELWVRHRRKELGQGRADQAKGVSEE